MTQIITSKKTQNLSEEEFFRCLFCALRLKGIMSIDMREARHHKNFKKITEQIAELKPMFPRIRMPLFIPEPFSGRYNEFETSMFSLQYTGLVSVQMVETLPICAKLAVTEERAKKAFGQFSPQCQEFFYRLIEGFPFE